MARASRHTNTLTSLLRVHFLVCPILTPSSAPPPPTPHPPPFPCLRCIPLPPPPPPIPQHPSRFYVLSCQCRVASKWDTSNKNGGALSAKSGPPSVPQLVSVLALYKGTVLTASAHKVNIFLLIFSRAKTSRDKIGQSGKCEIQTEISFTLQ